MTLALGWGGYKDNCSYLKCIAYLWYLMGRECRCQDLKAIRQLENAGVTDDSLLVVT